jgi:hypothetical protein
MTVVTQAVSKGRPSVRGLMMVVVTMATLAMCLTAAKSVTGASAQPSARKVYFTYCGVKQMEGCELRTTTESLEGSEPVSALPAWSDECGPGNSNPSTTVSEDGGTAVTLEAIGKAPGKYGEVSVCRLVVTNLVGGEQRVLPPYPSSLMRSIKAEGWSVSPNGQYMAISARSGVYLQDIQTATQPRLLRTGFWDTDGGIGWYADSSRLLIDGPPLPLGGRGPVNTTNRLFEFTVSGQRLGTWLIKPYPAYGFAARFIKISSTGQVFAGVETFYDTTFGGRPNMPAGYYSLRLQASPSAHLITRVSRTGYAVPVTSFGIDTERGLIFIGSGKMICSVAIASGARHCVTMPDSSGVQLALPSS